MSVYKEHYSLQLYGRNLRAAKLKYRQAPFQDWLLTDETQVFLLAGKEV
jgi:hypothetical protein